MVEEQDKYRAQFHQICGLALMTPAGSIVMDLRDLTLKEISLYFFFCLAIYIFLFLCGMLLVGRGLDFLEERYLKKYE